MNRSVRKAIQFGAIAVVVTGLAAWLWLRGETWTFTFTEQQLKEQLAQRFPLDKNYLIARVFYENPRVHLEHGASDIALGLDARVETNLNGKSYTYHGQADVRTQIAYNSDNGTFVLHNARLEQFQVDGMSDRISEKVMSVANKLASEQVGGIRVYKLRPDDVATAIARLVLQTVTIEDGILRVVVGI